MMKLLTIQNRKVAKLLQRENTYVNNFEHIIKSPFDNMTIQEENDESAKIRSYQVLMRHYDYIAPPVFCCINDRVVNFTGTNKNANVLLELEVPEILVKKHLFYKWEEIKDLTKNYDWTSDIYDIYKDYLDGKDTDKKDLAVQALIPLILPQWLVGIHKITDGFVEFYKNRKFYI